jgi:hypothetical protein
MAVKYNYVGQLQPHYEYRVIGVDRTEVLRLLEESPDNPRLQVLNNFERIKPGILPVRYKNEPYGLFYDIVEDYIYFDRCYRIKVVAEEYIYFTMNNGRSAIEFVKTATYNNIKTKLNIGGIDARLWKQFGKYKALLDQNPWKIYKALPVKERHVYKNAIKTAIYFMNVMHKLPPELIQIILGYACE